MVLSGAHRKNLISNTNEVCSLFPVPCSLLFS